MANNSAAAVQGALNLLDDFTERRIYDQSRICYLLERFENPFPHLLIESQGKEQFNDVEIKRYEQDEMPMKLRTKKVTATPGQIDIHNDDVGLIQPEYILQNSWINYSFVASTLTATYTTNTVASALLATVTRPDKARVTQIIGPGATGYTRVAIQRQDEMDGATTVNNLATALWDSETDGHYVSRLYKTNFEGGDAGNAVSKNMQAYTNYLAKNEHEYELTDWELTVEQFGTADLWAHTSQQAMKDYARKTTRMMLFSEGRKITPFGKLEPSTFGFNSIIQDSQRRSIASTTIASMNQALAPIINIGSKRDRYWICGGGFLTTFEQIPESKMIYNDPEMKKMIGISVTTYKDHYGGLHHLCFDREMTEDPLFTNYAFVVNFDYVKYAYLKGEDVRIWKGASGKGLQANSSPNLKAQIRATHGLYSWFRGDSTNPGPHGALYFAQ